MNTVYRALLATGYYGLVLLWTGMVGGASPFLYAYCRWALALSSGRAARQIIWVYGRGWSKIFTAFIPTTFHGLERELPSPCIFVANHQSFFDAYFMGAFPVRDIVFIVRSWPFRIPLYGFFMRGAEYIDAEAMTAEEFVDAGKRALQSGSCIVIFPEGTRSRTKEMGRFRSGAFVLATRTGVPIVPLCLDGTGDFLRRGEFLPRRAKVRVSLLEPLYPEDYARFGETAYRELRRDVKARLRENLEQQHLEETV